MSERAVPESVVAGRSGPDAVLVVVTANVIAEAVTTIAGAVGLPLVVLHHDDSDEPVADRLTGLDLTDRHAVVLTDHDAPGTAEVLRAALAGPAGYVGMMGSRRRAEGLFATLREEGVPEDALARLHVPVGLDVGGRSPGEMALSVVAEVSAWASGKLVRDGDRSRLTG
ncbi:XdhC family protein [Lapillicoccus jejuensis]|uniref:XdhC family protein n=1 Tax=Lapillicoccus jejuensis TaxID=402171 RepID=UPI001153AA8A|nr:XdhC family protein [Lapillicoccus jejuensis]